MTDAPTAPIWPADKVERRRIDTLMAYALNARTHSPEQVAQLAASIQKWGWTIPVLIDETGQIIAGHGRVMAAKQLGIDDIPVMVVTGWSDEDRRAYVLADNQLALNAGWDDEMLRAEIAALQAEQFDTSLIGFDETALREILGQTEPPDPRTPGALAERFGAPPFTILDTRQGYWTQRRGQWLQRTGSLSASKEGVLGSDSIIATINEGSSNFDPVLAELMMRWFCPAGGKVLDPFGGEQTKGVVAGTLGLQYRGVEFREDQVALNRLACAGFGDAVQYQCGDSEGIAALVQDRGFDLCFTSPPYYDLEVYSANDMSALGTYAEFMAKYERIFAACIAMMADDSWLVVKVGEIRDKATGIYRGFVPDNVAMFQRLGLAFYNEAVLINAAGTAPQRANKSMANRKLVKLHQNVLVFCKGDPVRAAQRCGELTGVDLGEDDDAGEQPVIDLTAPLPDLDGNRLPMDKIKISAASARLMFTQCGPLCQKHNPECGGRCCDTKSVPDGFSVAIQPGDEQARIEAEGGVVVGGMLKPLPGTKGCQFKRNGLCGLHDRGIKPFGCVASPFTPNRSGTMIIRNRYKMLPCYRGKGPKEPAYKAYRASLDLLLGSDEAQRLVNHLETGGGDLVVSIKPDAKRILLTNERTRAASLAAVNAKTKGHHGDA